jgi:DNA repair protein RecN (Recombination protein N)
MSLLRISLRDFVIVKSLELDLAQGFTALTGETGAGKSILIDALQLALGARADASVVREGQHKAEVSVEFTLNPAAAEWLKAEDLEENDHLLIRRTVDEQGKSRAWINGSPVTAAQLRAVSEHLVDIHGQHAWQSLMKPDSCRRLLDEFGQIPVQQLYPLWRTWITARERVAHAKRELNSMDERKDRLLWQLSEIEKLQPLAGEWPQLQAEHQRLAHAHGLIEAAQTAYNRLSEDEPNVLAELSRCLDVLQSKQSIDSRFGPICEALEQSEVVLREAVRDLQTIARHTDVDPERLVEVDQRIAQWLALAKRHRCDPEQLPEQWASWQQELHKLEALVDIEALTAAAQEAERCYRDMASVISRQRAQACVALSEQITAVIQKLGMEGGRFIVQLQALDEPVAQGLEAVDFLVAGHAGVSPRPVAKVASGGELSRIALAIAVTTSQLGQCPTLIFDEVDSGVGGRVARTVGELMQTLGQNRQVLTVTHLPQVAAYANHHLRVSKYSDATGTSSQLHLLNPNERIAEIARMLGGTGDSSASLAHAKEMLAL